MLTTIQSRIYNHVTHDPTQRLRFYLYATAYNKYIRMRTYRRLIWIGVGLILISTVVYRIFT